MRSTLIILAVLALFSWGAYRLYQDPRVQDLISKPERQSAPALPQAPKREPVPEAPALPQPSKRRTSVPSTRPVSPRKAVAVPSADEPAPAAPSGPNQIENSTVGRVMIQILAAKDLVEGITIGVADDSVMVAGSVDSEEKRKRILDIIEKGRGARRIDAKNLVVRR